MTPGLPPPDFLFIGGNLALNLVNTWRKRLIPGSKEAYRLDLLTDPRQADIWWRKACEKHGLAGFEDYRWSDGDFEDLIALRGELRSLFEAMLEGRAETASTRLLNRALGRGSFRVKIEGSRFVREYGSAAGRPDCLLQIALAAAELLSEHDPSRLHGCRNERCLALFYDNSKSGTRQWCRSECMNRARARENYRRSKEGL